MSGEIALWAHKGLDELTEEYPIVMNVAAGSEDDLPAPVGRTSAPETSYGGGLDDCNLKQMNCNHFR